jgi:quercetin dioxygenase-like cupin family protein
MLKTALPSMAASALLMLGVVGCAGEPTSSGDQASSDAASTDAKIEAIFSGSQTLNGTDLTYPEGKPELRLFRVELPAGGKIPLHTHPAPMLVYVQATDSGELLNTRVQPDGREVSSVFKPGESFIEGASEPHYVENKGDTPSMVWVMVASVEGLPTTEWIK